MDVKGGNGNVETIVDAEHARLARLRDNIVTLMRMIGLQPFDVPGADVHADMICAWDKHRQEAIRLTSDNPADPPILIQFGYEQVIDAEVVDQA
jgi:hypothetical protein